MSRNLGDIDCAFCNTVKVVLVERPRKITRFDCGTHFDEYEEMVVANAICEFCKAKYLAWVDGSKRKGDKYPHTGHDFEFTDMSFRSSFNDEPNIEDFPIFEISNGPDPYVICGFDPYTSYSTEWGAYANVALGRYAIFNKCSKCNLESKSSYKINYKNICYRSYCFDHEYLIPNDNPYWEKLSKDEIETYILIVSLLLGFYVV